MSRVHVLHVLNSAHGGSALSTFELIKDLDQKGIQSSLVCFDNAGAEQKKKISAIVHGRVIFIPLYWLNKKIRSAWWKRPVIEALSLWKTWGGYRYQASISSFIQKHGINVVHTSTILNPEGAIASRKNNIPHIWHVRELVGPDKHFHFYNYPRWANFVSNHCEWLVANSSVTEKCLLQFFSPDKIVCIPNGIAVQNFRVRNHSNNKEKIIVGMVGSMTTRWKNHALFIKTAAQFLERPHAVEFRIYGAIPADTDPYYIDIKELVKSTGTENIVRFVSFKSPEEIMEEIDIMFHPSEFESFGRIFVEAMAAGIPVIGLDEGGALEMIRHGVNGFLLPKEDMAAIKEHICRLIESEALRTDFGKKGRQLAEEKYSLDQLSNEMASLYKRVVNQDAGDL